MAEQAVEVGERLDGPSISDQTQNHSVKSNVPPGLRPFVAGEARTRAIALQGSQAGVAARRERTSVRALLENGLQRAIEGLLQEIEALQVKQAAPGKFPVKQQRDLRYLLIELGKLCKSIVPVSVHHTGSVGIEIPGALPDYVVARLGGMESDLRAAGLLGDDGLPVLEAEVVEVQEVLSAAD